MLCLQKAIRGEDERDILSSGSAALAAHQSDVAELHVNLLEHTAQLASVLQKARKEDNSADKKEAKCLTAVAAVEREISSMEVRQLTKSQHMAGLLDISETHSIRTHMDAFLAATRKVRQWEPSSIPDEATWSVEGRGRIALVIEDFVSNTDDKGQPRQYPDGDATLVKFSERMAAAATRADESDILEDKHDDLSLDLIHELTTLNCTLMEVQAALNEATAARKDARISLASAQANFDGATASQQSVSELKDNISSQLANECALV